MNQSILPEIRSVMPAVAQVGLYPSLCTISAPPSTSGNTGAPAPVGQYTPIQGLIDIPCMDAVVSPSHIQATEVRDMAEILSKGYRHVFLNGYYPQIIFGGVQAGWIATVDSVQYELIGAEPDSFNTQTRLHLALLGV